MPTEEPTIDLFANHPDPRIGAIWQDAFDSIQSATDNLSRFLQESGYVDAERAYIPWALDALSALTAYANDLSDDQLDALVADMHAHPNNPRRDLPIAKRMRLAFPASTADAVICTDRIARATEPNLGQLKSLGWPCYQAGLAVFTQGVVEHPEVIDILAGPWIRCGHPFPRHEWIAWTSPRWQGGPA